MQDKNTTLKKKREMIETSDLLNMIPDCVAEKVAKIMVYNITPNCSVQSASYRSHE